jgi:glycogen(starch) synthase
MDTLTPPLRKPGHAPLPARNGHHAAAAGTNGHNGHNGHHGHNGYHEGPPLAATLDPETLRQVGWEIGNQKPAEAFVPAANHVGLAVATPAQGFAHWRILQPWIDQTASARGNAWQNCRLVLRLYDVSFINFNGMNAHHIHDIPLPRIDGHLFFKVPRPGTWQLGEVGFLLRNGEFIAAARSQTVLFPADGVSPRGDHAALLVTPDGRREEVGNLWEQERILRERRQPRLRKPLRIAAFTFAARALGHEGVLADFVSELAAGQSAQGHDVHVFVPASERIPAAHQEQGVHYEPLPVSPDGSPLDVALRFAQAAQERLDGLAPFDLFHLHEWMTGLAPWIGTRPTVLSLSSIEASRRNGSAATDLSREVQRAERGLAHAVDCILTPPWLRNQAVAELGVDAANVHAFPMEARMPDEWECPLDYGQVKKDIGVGPLDRLMLFVGPLEHGAGVDLLLEALPVLLRRVPNLRLALVGDGPLSGHLHHRARELGVDFAVRVLGHVEGPLVTRLMRAAEALVLPSRHRICFDDAVVDLARRASRPVVTTHGGPAHLVRHEENGIVTYDNPGSMVWALDRILSDPAHAERMGQSGKRGDGGMVSWAEVARRYLELCAACFPELAEPHE